MNSKVSDIITQPGKKKILAIDGGGTRSCITIEILDQIESMLRTELKKDESFVLSDYFDFFAGTSVGAIISCFLSLGMPVRQIRDTYKRIGAMMFQKNAFLRRWRSKFTCENITAGLKEAVGEETLLGTDKLNTLVMLVMRNASTDSPWPITNNPYAAFNDRELPDCNLDLPLWQLIRASTAAPTFFPPEKITIGSSKFHFEDGAISTYNDPAFLAFLQATVGPYNINWKTGEEDIFLVSVGNGYSRDQQNMLNSRGKTLLGNAKSIPGNLLNAALTEQDTLCRVFGRCLLGDKIDSEIGTLIDAPSPVTPKLFTYLRYNFEITEKYLEDIGMADLDIEIVKRLDAVEHFEELHALGRVAGKRLVDMEHYQNFLFLNTNN